MSIKIGAILALLPQPQARPSAVLRDELKRVRADIAAGGPESRAREDAGKEARYAAFLKSRTAADLARSDELIGLLCSTDGRLPGHAVARLAELRSSSIGGANP